MSSSTPSPAVAHQHQHEHEHELLSLCQKLIRTPSENPPGSTRAMAEVVVQSLTHPAINIKLYEPAPGIVNLVAVLRGHQAGPRVVLNGHLDTFPVGPSTGWLHDPHSGHLEGGRIYGRGAGDMKAGVAVLIHVMLALADRQAELQGELVLTLMGDEETGGRWGTRWLLNNIPEARGDFLLNTDAGHPRVVRHGEKGVVWLKLLSTGKACHGAHVHLGDNAIESMMNALQDLLALRQRTVKLPPDLLASMTQAKAISEIEGGAGEFENLCSITVNVGALHSGSAPNLVPGCAEAFVDIRYPPGLDGVGMRALIAKSLASHSKVSWEVVPDSETEPAFTAPGHRLVQTFLRHARRLVEPDVVANMRVGLTDARLFRHAGMPAVVYGPTAFNMGGINEYVLIAHVVQVFEVNLAVASELLGLCSS